MIEVTVAIVGAVATVLSAVVPLVVQRASANRPPPLPLAWPLRLAAGGSAAFIAVGFVLATFSGPTVDYPFEASVLTYVEVLVLAAIAAAILGYLGHRQAFTVLAVFGYTNAFFILLAIAHVLLSRRASDPDLEVPGSYCFVVFLIVASSVAAFLISFTRGGNSPPQVRPN